MIVIFILLALTAAQAGVVEDPLTQHEGPECDGVEIQGVYYERETLKTDIDRPFLLAVDYSTNNVYFSYSIDPEEDLFKTARLNMNTKEYNDIESVKNGFAQTIDRKTHEIYIGGSDGIYKYDRNANTAKFVGARNANIWHIYFNEVLYYSAFPEQILYTFIDGTSTRFKYLQDTKVDLFVIDNENEMFFTNKSGLYGQRMEVEDAVLYQEFHSGQARALTADINGRAYVCFQDGIYTINKDPPSIEKVLDVDDAFGLSFDNNNDIVYSDATSLVRLRPNKHKRC